MARKKFLVPVTAIIEVALLVAFASAARGKAGSLESEFRMTGAQEDKVIAYYFHNTIRCATCLRMESYSKHAIEAGFRPELNSGRVEFRIVNMQLPENRHFAKEFHLNTSSLILVHLRDGKQVHWRNMELVWDFVGDLSTFMKYVQSAVRKYLDAR